MENINFNNKLFKLVLNSDNGTVTQDTVFEYKQDGSLVTADYYGGSVKYGKIIAFLEEATLNMLYQCLTTQNELKAGKAAAQIELDKNGKMNLYVDWEWLEGGEIKGKSVYIEIT